MDILRRVFGGRGFPHRIDVYVFGTRNLVETLTKVEHEALVRRTAGFLAKRFGGATALTGTGFYELGDTLVTEKITLVYAYSKRLSTEDREAVRQYAKELKSEYGQDSTAVVFDGVFELL